MFDNIVLRFIALMQTVTVKSTVIAEATATYEVTGNYWISNGMEGGIVVKKTGGAKVESSCIVTVNIHGKGDRKFASALGAEKASEFAKEKVREKAIQRAIYYAKRDGMINCSLKPYEFQ